MRFLLRLKHWQLFLITWGLPIGMNIFTLIDPQLMLKLFPIMMIVFSIGIFGWVWAIATVLHKKLPAGVNLNIGQFKMLFFIPIIYMLFIILWIGYQFYFRTVVKNSNMGEEIIIILFMHFLSMICIFLGLRFAAKTMRSVELGRLARFSDYVGEFFLIWFSPFGFWFLQPRLNKLAED